MGFMRNWLTKLAISIICGLFTFGMSYAHWGDSQAIADAMKSVVTVVTYDSTGRIFGQGTGFFVGMWNDVITNQHVLAGAESARVITANGDTLKVERILYVDTYSDLVQVSLDMSVSYAESLKMRTSLPTEGESIVVVGSLGGVEQTMTFGHIKAIRQLPNFGDIIQIDARIEPGSSGSPILDTLGNVLGVATFFLPDGDFLGFAMPAERVTKLCNNSKINLPVSNLDESLFGLYRPMSLLLEGYIYVWAGDYATALEKAKLVVENSPNEPLSLILLAGCYGKVDSLDKAILAFERAKNLDDKVAGIVCGDLAFLYAKVGRLEEAALAWEQKTESEPGNGEAFEAMGRVLGNLNKHEESLDAFRRATELLPRSPTAFFGLGKAYFSLGRYAECISACQRSLQFDSLSAETFRIIGKASYILGFSEQAIESYKSAISNNPADPTLYIEFGYFHLGMGYGTPSSAATLFQKAIQMDSGSALALCGLGNAYNKMERYTDAILPFSKSITIDSTIPEAYGGLGYAYLNLDKIDLAVDALESGVKLNPEYKFARMLLAWIYYKKGDVDSAMRHYRALKEFDPASAEELLESFKQ